MVMLFVCMYMYVIELIDLMMVLVLVFVIFIIVGVMLLFDCVYGLNCILIG